MAQAQTARITCRVCDGWYETDRDLREHMQAAHRRFISAPSSASNSSPGDTQYVGAHPKNVKTEARRPNEQRADVEESPVSILQGRAAR
jgi:hypothetical protein